MSISDYNKWSESEEQKLREEYSIKNTREIADDLDRSYGSVRYKAQEMNLSKDKHHDVKHRINKSDNISFNNEELGHFIAGLTSGEGSFVVSKSRETKMFTFQISLAEQDKDMIYELKDFFGVGCIVSEEYDNHYQTLYSYRVTSSVDIATTIIPFFEKYSLRNTHKETQYEEWKNEFFKHYDIDETGVTDTE